MLLKWIVIKRLEIGTIVRLL